MALSRVKWDTVVITGLLLLAMALGVTIKLQSLSKALLIQQNKQLKQEKSSAEAITTNTLRATILFNDIARATHYANQASNAQSEHRVVVIRKLVKGNICATDPVPRDVVNQLRTHRDKIRSGSASTNTGKLAG